MWSLQTSQVTNEVSAAWRDYEYFHSTLDGMLVYRKAISSIKLTTTHLYTWVETEALWK